MKKKRVLYLKLLTKLINVKEIKYSDFLWPFLLQQNNAIQTDMLAPSCHHSRQMAHHHN